MFNTWNIIRTLLFQLDAEDVHVLTIKSLKFLSYVLPTIKPNTRASVDVLGLHFPNPLGLAAGFDKDGEAIPIWQALGFGFVEVGTVTAIPQLGNSRPRLFRIPTQAALKNSMGFNNAGAAALSTRLHKLKAKNVIKIPVGINIGKSKVVPLENAPQDYCKAFQYVEDVADYVAINISSPNTPHLRDLQSTEMIKYLLDKLLTLNARRSKPVPVLVKLSPDLIEDVLIQCSKTALDCGAQGLILANTSTSTGLLSHVPGGISGLPLRERANAMVHTIRSVVNQQALIIGVGGISSPIDAQQRLASGATLIQTYTGFVYGGPSFAKSVTSYLKER
jgi:dihydroorotate dehydrogenase